MAPVESFPMTTSTLSAQGLRLWAERATSELHARRAEINQLNVFPVPDADTGSNMAYTMQEALRAVDGLAEDEHESVSAVAGALATGAVKGARGNSGMVLSQVLRGLAQSAAIGRIDGAAVQEALRMGLSFVTKAINDPVEGTVITVLRAASVAADLVDPADLTEVLKAAASAAATALAHTPSQLAVLREAGVVDAGGQGLVILIDAMRDQVVGLRSPVATNTHCGDSAPEPAAGGSCLEVMFLLGGIAGRLEEVRTQLRAFGDSFVMAEVPGEDAATVHIHTTVAGPLIEAAFRLGQVSDLRLEVLPEYTVDAPARVVMVMTPPGDLAALYQEAGAHTVVKDADRSVLDVVSQARKSGAGEVIFLPNGMLSKQELVSIERSSLAQEQTMTIVPTGCHVKGLAALAVHDSSQPLAVDSYAMAEAASAMRVLRGEPAGSARLTPAGACSRTDILLYAGTEVIAVADNLVAAVAIAIDNLLTSGGEQVTILSNELIEVTAVYEQLGAVTAQGVDIEVFHTPGLESLVEIGVE